MDTAAFDTFTETLVEHLCTDEGIISLVAVGSLADSTLRDPISDHDCWIIVVPEAQDRVRHTLTWLPNPHNVLSVIQFPVRGTTVLYRDGHVLEFLVLTEEELSQAVTDRYAMLFDKGHIGNLMPQVVARTRAQRLTDVVWQGELSHLCVVVWTGTLRGERGERLSAQKYLRYFAANSLMNLVQAAGLMECPSANPLDPWRRIEHIQPDLAKELGIVLERPLPEVGIGLLDLAKAYVKPCLPALDWSVVVEVRKWLVTRPSGGIQIDQA